MKAIILAAGRGSRLSPLTNTTPKPLLVVRGRPLIVRQLDQLKEAGITEVVINLHHLGEQIEKALGDGDRYGVHIRYSHEATLLETGGGIKQALPLLDDDEFLVCNGDIFSDFQFSHLPPKLGEGDLAHLVLTPKPSSRTAGDFNSTRGRITERGDNYVYCGISIFSKRIFTDSPRGAFSTRDLMFEAIKTGQLSAQIHSGMWTDIGTIGDYEKANSLN